MTAAIENRNSKVSVIIPTYNRAHLVYRSIKSVLTQSYQNFEIIVVDDGSTDNTRNAVFQFKDERIKYFRHSTNKGVAAARNTGLRHAESEFIAFNDIDDEWLPGKLAAQMAVFQCTKRTADIVYTKIFRKSVYGNTLIIPNKNIIHKEGMILKELLCCCFVGIQSAVIRKKCFDKVGFFDERLWCASDWEMWIRLSKVYCFDFIDEVYTMSYQRNDSLTTDSFIFERIRAHEIIQKKFEKEFLNSPKAILQNLIVDGMLHCRSKQMRKGRSFLIKAYKQNPLNFNCLMRLTATLFGRNVFFLTLKMKQVLSSFAKD